MSMSAIELAFLNVFRKAIENERFQEFRSRMVSELSQGPEIFNGLRYFRDRIEQPSNLFNQNSYVEFQEQIEALKEISEVHICAKRKKQCPRCLIEGAIQEESYEQFRNQILLEIPSLLDDLNT